jgi:hypothetical protein
MSVKAFAIEPICLVRGYGFFYIKEIRGHYSCSNEDQSNLPIRKACRESIFWLVLIDLVQF